MQRSRYVLPLCCALLVFAGTAAAVEPGIRETSRIPGITEEYWQQDVDYEIAVSLDPAAKTLAGRERITYKNNSPDTLEEFFLHLYANAYRNRVTPLWRDFHPGILWFIRGIDEERRGWIEVDSLAVDETPADFTVEGTILESAFPHPLPPGATVTIDLVFRERIRRRTGRAGWSGSNFAIAQWYPKMAVYDVDGWHPDQFRLGEFYGEFGSFDVSITLPEPFVVAATGLPVAGDPGWDRNPPPAARATRPRGGGHPGGHPGGRPPAARPAPAGEAAGPPRTVRFRAERVHDFAWVADPRYAVQDTLWHGVRVMSVFRDWNTAWADTTLAQTLRTLAWLEKTAGPCPYPQITVADSPGHGGMEYPMICMNGFVDESLVLHEVAHNWFYGALGNDERDEAWLDEGFVQYLMFRRAEETGAAGRYAGGETGAAGPWAGISRPVIEQHRGGFAERIATPHHELVNGAHTTVYLKSALFLRALRYRIGPGTFDEALRRYVERWKFKHVDETAFRSVCEEASGEDLGDFFMQWLHSTKTCDYRLRRFTREETPGGWKADIVIEREGEAIMPLTLVFRLDDGNTVAERLDGMPRTIERSFTFEIKPVSCEINPDNEILDTYVLDNRLPRRRSLALDLPPWKAWPHDAYEYRLLPFGYYNDVDGGKAGLRLRGSYDGLFNNVTLQGAWGFESETFDAYGAWSSPFGYLGRDASIELEGYVREGRRGASIALSKILRSSRSDPLARHLSLFLRYHELTDEEYVFPWTYDTGQFIETGLGIELRPRSDIADGLVRVDLSRSTWGSDDSWEQAVFETRIEANRRFPGPFAPALRLWFGHSSIDPPLQERFNLAGAGALDKERYFWLRSVGAFPKDDYGRFHVPGDANLRGYYDGDFGFKQIFAANGEIALPFPLPGARRWRPLRDRRLYLFGDAGQVLDERPLEALPPGMRDGFDETVFDGFLADAGIGLRIWRLTVELPLWVSNPELNGESDEWDLRWTVGIDALF